MHYIFHKSDLTLSECSITAKTAAKAALWLLGGLGGALSYVSMLKVSAVAINFAAFVLLADVYYALSRRVLKDEYLAYKVRICGWPNRMGITCNFLCSDGRILCYSLGTGKMSLKVIYVKISQHYTVPQCLGCKIV